LTEKIYVDPDFVRKKSTPEGEKRFREAIPSRVARFFLTQGTKTWKKYTKYFSNTK
jgi:hypothetical protein